MAIKIHEFGVEVPGPVVRKYDQASGITTLTFNAEQAQAVYESTGLVLDFLQTQEDQ